MVYHRTQSEWVKELPRMESLTGNTREWDKICRYLESSTFSFPKIPSPILITITKA